MTTNKESRPGDLSGATKTKLDGFAAAQHTVTALDRPLHIATGARKTAKAWWPGTITWSEIAAWVTDPRTGGKDGPAYVLGELAVCTCPERAKPHAHRNADSVIGRSVLSLDVDHLNRAKRRALLVSLRKMGCAAVVYSTYSSTEDKPRLRLLVLLARDVTPDEYQRLAQTVMQHLGWWVFDRGSQEPWRLMYMPTVGADGSYDYEVIDGDPLLVEEWLARWEPTQIARSHPTAKQEPTTVPGIVGTFNREYTVAEAIEVYDLPYVLDGTRYLYTGSTTGDAGVTVLSDDLVYSHHTSDPAYGQACSAFDLVRIHRFGEEDARGRPDTPVHKRASHKAMSRLANADERVRRRSVSETFQTPGVESADLPAPITMEQCHAVFRRWLGDSYDLGALDAVLAAAAVERMDGDPLWLLVVAGSGNAKTETVQALQGVGALLTSTISSEGALLSATSARDVAVGATGGLLRQVQPRGLIVIKDVTSILSMSRDARAAVLAALREVYDGYWTRAVGTDGGRELTWAGRVGLVGAVTTAWDQAHTVISTMGDRFVLVRTDSNSKVGRRAAARQTLANTGSEAQMRKELSDAVAGVIAGMGSAPAALTVAEQDRLMDAAELVTLARTAVESDYRGEVLEAHAAEAPTRFTRQLQQIVRGAVALGVGRDYAVALAIRCARDSMPPLRLAVIDHLADHPDQSSWRIYRALDKPRSSVKRTVDQLHELGVLTVNRDEDFNVDHGWRYSLHPDHDPAVLRLDGR